MNDDRFFGRKHAVQVWHSRIERKKIIEFQRRHFSIQCERIVAPQREPIRIADRGHRGQPIQRAAKNDCEKTRVATLSPRELR